MSNLPVTDLKTLGLAGGIVKREMTWIDAGEKRVFDIYIKPADYRTTVTEFKNIRDGVSEDDSLAHKISEYICDENGNKVFEPGDVKRMKHSLVQTIWIEIIAANSLGKTTS